MDVWGGVYLLSFNVACKVLPTYVTLLCHLTGLSVDNDQEYKELIQDLNVSLRYLTMVIWIVTPKLFSPSVCMCMMKTAHTYTWEVLSCIYHTLIDHTMLLFEKNIFCLDMEEHDLG